jgi:hypothetical protein
LKTLIVYPNLRLPNCHELARLVALSTLCGTVGAADAGDCVSVDPTLAEAILDRLVHNAYRLPLQGDSMRKQGRPTPVSPPVTP